MNITDRISIEDSTSRDDIDIFLIHLFEKKRKTYLEIDTSNCRKVSVKKILSFKDVLNKHKENTKRYVDKTKIIVKNGFVSKIVKTGLYFLKPEIPVEVVNNVSIAKH